ncbi:MAG: general secretion pathway protein GspK [Planctomycetes bacterium]|nr:general secretion pathway protein GspK [Planctomycetota bacterium]
MNLKKLLQGLSLCPDSGALSTTLQPEAPAPPRRGERLAKSGGIKGSVLVITIWIISALVIFVIGLSMIVSNRIVSFKILRDSNRAYLSALGALNKEIAEIHKEAASSQYDCLNERWSNYPEEFNNIEIGGDGMAEVSYEYPAPGEGSTILYGCADEERLININKAGPTVLETLFKEIVGLEQFQATSLADCIIDWRDADDAIRPYGAEAKEYESITATYSCKNAAFDIPEELMLVKGVTADIYRKIKDTITVYGSGRININTATEQSLIALGLPASLIRKISRFRLGKDNAIGTEDDNIVTKTEGIVALLSQVEPLSGDESAKLNDLVIQDLITVESRYFRIKAKGTVNEKTRQITCVVRRGGGIVFWQE